MEKLNFFGAGPKIGMVTIPWLALTILFTLKMKDTFYITEGGSPGLRTTGIIILAAGLLLYFITVRGLLKGLKETKLIISGGFFLCQNPLYSSLILLILPGIALLMNSWLILTSSAVGYLMFRMNIKTEYKELEKLFGESYLKYKRETPEFFPFPLKKLFR